jgi:capsular exopolysaccharide synthesis family protein
MEGSEVREGSMSRVLKDRLAKSQNDLAALEAKLVAIAGAKPLKSLMVISASAGEGRTTAAACLGCALSALGRTLLIDAHLNNPDLCQQFSVSTEPGLSEVVLGAYPLASALHPTEVENLFILPTGRPLPNAPALLRAEAFASLFAQLSQNWDYVICDTAPFLTNPDATIIAHHFDGAIIVLACEATQWETAHNVLNRLEAAKGKLIGAILNNRRYYIPRFIHRMIWYPV